MSVVVTNPNDLVTTTQVQSGQYVFSPTVDGQAVVILKGAGGGGGGLDSFWVKAGAGGGGGGGALVQTVQLEANADYLCLVGSGGVAGVQGTDGGGGGDTSLTGGGLSLTVSGGAGGKMNQQAVGGTGGDGGEPNGGGGGGGGGANNDNQWPYVWPGGAGGAGASQGGSGGEGGASSRRCPGSSGGGGGAGGAQVDGQPGYMSQTMAPAQGGAGATVQSNFQQPLTPGPGLNGGNQPLLNICGSGGGGGGACLISATDTSGQGGRGGANPYSPYSYPANQPFYAAPGQDGLISIQFSEFLVFHPPPQIDSIDPVEGGTTTLVTIRGSNFSRQLEKNVIMLGNDWSVVPVTATEDLLAFYPPSMPNPVQVVVVSRGLASAPGSQTFTFVSAPTLDSVSPEVIGIGNQLTLYGDSFDVGDNTVNFSGGTTQAGQVVSSTEMTVTVPAGTTSGPVYVSNPGGGSDSVDLQIQPVPTITKVPDLASSGTSVTIEGTGFSTDDLSTLVQFSNASVWATVASATELTVRVPSRAVSGPMSIVVNDVSSEPVVILIKSYPKIRGLSPTTLRPGDVLTITGIDYSSYNSYTVTFQGTGNNVAPASYQSPTALSVVVPKGAKSGTLTLTANGASTVSTQRVTITA